MLPICNQYTKYECNPGNNQRWKPFIIVYPVVNRLSFSANSSFYAARATLSSLSLDKSINFSKNCQNPDITKILFVFPEIRSIGFSLVTNFRYKELIFRVPSHFVIIGCNVKWCALCILMQTHCLVYKTFIHSKYIYNKPSERKKRKLSHTSSSLNFVIWKTRKRISLLGIKQAQLEVETASSN